MQELISAARVHKCNILAVREINRMFKQPNVPTPKDEYKPKKEDKKTTQKSKSEKDKERQAKIVADFKEGKFIASDYFKKVRPGSCIWYDANSHLHHSCDKIRYMSQQYPNQPNSQSNLRSRNQNMN